MEHLYRSGTAGTEQMPRQGPWPCRFLVLSKPDATTLREPEIALAYGTGTCYSSVPALLNIRSAGQKEKQGVDGNSDKPHNLPSLLLNKTLQQVTQNSLKINSR
jgi:hypothetical protein